MAIFEEAFDIVSNTFRIPKLKCAAKIWNWETSRGKKRCICQSSYWFGNSLPYQALPLVFDLTSREPGHIVVVFSPLISLMEDPIKGNQGQYSVSKQQRHTQGPAQLNSIRHSITKTGTAQQRQAKANKDRHSPIRTGTAQYGQAQPNKDRHSRTKTGTAEQRQAQLSLRKTGNQAF